MQVWLLRVRGMKEFYGRWKYSKKRGCWVWKWKKRKVKKRED